MHNRTFKIVLVAILIFIIVSLTGFLIFALSSKNYNFSLFNINGGGEIIDKVSYNMNQVDLIKINTKNADVRFVFTDEDVITATVYGSKDNKPTIDLINGTFDIDYAYSTFCFGFCFDNSYIEIALPKDYTKDISVTSISGDVDIHPFQLKKLLIDTVSGDINIGSFYEGKITSVSGEIEIDSFDEGDVKSTSGDISIGNVNKMLNAETVSGEISINDMNLKANSKIKTISGDVDISRINDVFIETSTRSGDVDVKNNNRLADVVLDITTTSGDIDVD